MRSVMPPCFMYVRSALIDIYIPDVNVWPGTIDPASVIPSVIYDMMVGPVEVHGQPAPDHQAEAERDERRITRCRTFIIYYRRLILGNIYVLRLGWNDLNVVAFDNDTLFFIADQIAGIPCPPSESLDRASYVLRLV